LDDNELNVFVEFQRVRNGLAEYIRPVRVFELLEPAASDSYFLCTEHGAGYAYTHTASIIS